MSLKKLVEEITQPIVEDIGGIVAGDGTIKGGSKLSKIKKMKKKGHTSVPYGSGYKKIKEKLDKHMQNVVYSIVDNGDFATILKEQKKIKHHLYGFLSIKQKFSTGQWLKLAFKKIKLIQKKNKIPILVGGTGL